MGHDYDIRYRSSAESSNAPALSRLPASPAVAFDREEEVGAITPEVMQITTEVINEFTITSKLVGGVHQEGYSPVACGKLRAQRTFGPECKMDALKPYFNAQMEM